MLPYVYDPENFEGKIWWNENNPKMREIWGTQEDYDNFKMNGGTWLEYEQMIQNKFASNNTDINENQNAKEKTLVITK